MTIVHRRPLPKILCLTALASVLVGCATQRIKAPVVPDPYDVKAKFDKLYLISTTPAGTVLTGSEQNGTPSTERKRADGTGNPGPPGGTATPRFIAASEYAESGYTVVDESCNAFFDLLSKSTNSLQMTKSDWTALGAAAASIIALAHTASSKAVGVAAAAFALGSAGLDNYQKYALLTPYPDQTKKLVLQAMSAYRTASPAEGATDFINADARVSGYARLCTYSGITSLAEQAISTATTQPAAQPATSVFTSAADQQKVQSIATALNLQGQTISDKDLALLDIMGDAGTAAALLPQIALQLTPSVKAAVWDDAATSHVKPAVSTVQPALSSLATSNQAFAKMIADIKSATAAASVKPQGSDNGGRPADIEPTPTLVVPASVNAPWQPPTILVNGGGR